MIIPDIRQLCIDSRVTGISTDIHVHKSALVDITKLYMVIPKTDSLYIVRIRVTRDYHKNKNNRRMREAVIHYDMARDIVISPKMVEDIAFRNKKRLTSSGYGFHFCTIE